MKLKQSLTGLISGAFLGSAVAASAQECEKPKVDVYDMAQKLMVLPADQWNKDIVASLPPSDQILLVKGINALGNQQNNSLNTMFGQIGGRLAAKGAVDWDLQKSYVAESIHPILDDLKEGTIDVAQALIKAQTIVAQETLAKASAVSVIMSDPTVRKDALCLSMK